MKVKVKRFAAHAIENGKTCSPAEQCKEMMEFHGTSGKKCVSKYKKREEDMSKCSQASPGYISPE